MSRHVQEGAARGVARGALALAISGPAGVQRTARLSRRQVSCSLFADRLQTVLRTQTFPSSLLEEPPLTLQGRPVLPPARPLSPV